MLVRVGSRHPKSLENAPTTVEEATKGLSKHPLNAYYDYNATTKAWISAAIVCLFESRDRTPRVQVVWNIKVHQGTTFIGLIGYQDFIPTADEKGSSKHIACACCHIRRCHFGVNRKKVKQLLLSVLPKSSDKVQDDGAVQATCRRLQQEPRKFKRR